MHVYYLKNGTSMNFNFYELLKLKKAPFYRPIKNLLKFHPKSLKYYKRAFTHRSSNNKDLKNNSINLSCLLSKFITYYFLIFFIESNLISYSKFICFNHLNPISFHDFIVFENLSFFLIS